MQAKNTVLYQQQQYLQSSRAAELRTGNDMTRNAGEKIASAVSGSQLNFSKILARETEKQRRQQHFREEQEADTKKTQSLLAG